MEVAALSEPAFFTELETSPAGLSQAEAARRLRQYGANTLHVVKGVSFPRRFLAQFTHFLALLLWIAAGLSFLADALQPGQGMAMLGWTILAVIAVNAVFSFVQEYKAERATEALHRLLPKAAWVCRADQNRQVDRHELVPGDVLLLEEGEQVPADARLIEAVGMRVDMSALTGEAAPKRRRARPSAGASPLDADNIVFAGTTVLSGHGRAVVYATGGHTEFGKIAHLISAVDGGPSPLQREIARVTHVVALLSSAMGLLFFLIGLSMGVGFWVSAVFGIGIIVANVPEGLLPTVTLALAMGSQRMAKRRALIKQLTSVETLGCTTVICTDKTGTLTENRMRVERLEVGGRELAVGDAGVTCDGHRVAVEDLPQWRPLLDALTHCNNARRARRADGQVAMMGDPTETALLDLAVRQGVPVPRRIPRMGELPFDADRKRMSTLHWVEGQLIAYVKGAPEFVLPLCSRLLGRNGAEPLTPEEQQRILGKSRSFAQQAYRVLAVATREIPQGHPALTAETVEQELTFLGLVAMMDPPHREVPEAVARCRQAGIRIIMTTGDHPLTALAVARLIGLVPQTTDTSGQDIEAIEGARLDAMDDRTLRRLLLPGAPGRPEPVFARMTPRHKLRIVSLLKQMGEVVAVTGDGVNDAPALRQADIGIAMGLAGTDVAKETADMILLDDNFATIVNAVEEGRAVYANIRKFVTYVLASNVPEVVPYLGYGLAGWPLALTIPQILVVDLGTDMIPAVALGSEAPHAAVMDAPPRPRTERLLNLPLLIRSYLFLGMIEAGLALAAFFGLLHAQGWSWGVPLDWSDPLYRQATTATLAAIVVAQGANVFACRSELTSVFRLGVTSNRLLLLGIAVELLLLGLIVYTPPGNLVFGTEPLPAAIWPALILGAGGLLAAEEIRKALRRRRIAAPGGVLIDRPNKGHVTAPQ